MTPTEAEIRAALAAVPVVLDPDAGGQEASDAASDAFHTLWTLDDLRPTEDAAYSTIVSAAMDRVGERLGECLRVAFLEEVLRAGVEFAAACPGCLFRTVPAE